jgi:hypothetical protein
VQVALQFSRFAISALQGLRYGLGDGPVHGLALEQAVTVGQGHELGGLG